MYCPNCGSQIQDGHKFCPNCGANINEDSNSRDVVSPQVRPETIPTKPKKKKKTGKILLIILAVIVVFTVILGALNSSQDSAKPANSGQSTVSNSTKKSETTTDHTAFLNTTISITGSYVSDPDYAGGVDYHFEFKNLSDKEIKYLTVKATPYNAVGDPVKCQIRMESQFSGKITGPIEPGANYGSDSVFRAAWYNNTITSVSIDSISIEYMDGSIVSITDKDDIAKISAF